MQGSIMVLPIAMSHLTKIPVTGVGSLSIGVVGHGGSYGDSNNSDFTIILDSPIELDSKTLLLMTLQHTLVIDGRTIKLELK